MTARVARIASALLWPFATLLALAGVRFLTGGNVLTRIGHMALAPDLYVKTGLLGWRPRYRGVLLAPRGTAINPALLGYWGRYMRIVTHPWLVKLLRLFERQPQLQWSLGFVRLPDEPASNPVKIIPAVYRIQAAYEAQHGGRALLRLTDRDEARGRRRLEQLGVPRDAWFVCLHVREPGYLPELAYHSYRNADVMSYLPAAAAIVERGGWVLRMGDPSMTALPRMRGVVDYVHSGLRSDWMDVFCFARCRWFLGDTSGPFNVAFVFGVPCALANFIAVGHGPYSGKDLWIPKRLRSTREDRDMTFAEILRSPSRAWCRTEEYEAGGLAWVDNSPEEIRELAIEMLDRLEHRGSYSREDVELQRRFQSLLEAEPRWATAARVGREFLRRHAALLEEGPGDRPTAEASVLVG